MERRHNQHQACFRRARIAQPIQVSLPTQTTAAACRQAPEASAHTRPRIALPSPGPRPKEGTQAILTLLDNVLGAVPVAALLGALQYQSMPQRSF